MNPERHGLKPVTTIAVLTVVLGLLQVPFAKAGSQIISANPHPVTPCDATAPPLATIANNSKIGANAYHTTNPNPTCTVTTVTSSAFPSYDKPKIVSSDGGDWNNMDALNWIDTIKNAGAHYEHYERYFDCGLCMTCAQGGCPDTTCPQRGDKINDINDFPAGSASLRQKLGANATRLLPNGTLTRSGDKFHWTGSGGPITLMGYSWMGALAGLNFDIDGYLDVLQGAGINFTRVFAIEQWTALAVDGCSSPNVGNGLTPFSGNLTSKWDLNQMNNAFFSRAQQFIQAAADRGIVVQISLFEHVGLEKEGYGQSQGSPYNRDNNFNGYLDYSFLKNKEAPPDFVDISRTNPGNANRRYITEVVSRLGAYDNVIFEIMNEPKDEKWTADAVRSWHEWVIMALDTEFARTLVTAPAPKSQSVVPGGTAVFTVSASSPFAVSYLWQRQPTGGGAFVNLADDGRISGSRTGTLRIAAASSADAGSYRCLVTGAGGAANSGPAGLTLLAGGLAVRDGFGAADGTILSGRITEAGGKVWTADNVKISGGKAKSNNETGEWRLLAGVPVSLNSLKVAVIEADLHQQNIGAIALGFPAGSPVAIFEQTENSLWVEFTRAGLLSLRKRVGGVAATIASFDMTAIGFVSGNTVNVRLVYRTSPSTQADVYINGIRRITNAKVGFTPSIQYAGFQARRASSSAPYSEADGDIDNFVVTLSAQ